MQLKHSSNDDSIKHLRERLDSLNDELRKTSEHLQLLAIENEAMQVFKENARKREEEIDRLIRKRLEVSQDIIKTRKRIQKLSAKTILKIEIIILPIIAILLAYYLTTNQIPVDTSPQIKTRYLVENLRGESIDTWKHWNLANGQNLTINIINSDNVTPDKITTIKEAILSTERIQMTSPLFKNESPDGIMTYYKGWKGALEQIPASKYNLPKDFTVIESERGEGNIIITLSKLKDEDGYSGYTKTITDGPQLLKAFITIYEADKLDNSQLSAITRHEFGHALGLKHSNDPNDLMHATIETEQPYISPCDIDGIQSLYDGKITSNVSCNK